MATFNYVTKDNMGATLDHKINQGLVTNVLGTPDVALMNGGNIHVARVGMPVKLQTARRFT